MSHPKLARAIVLTFLLLTASAGAVFAHALPGSLITFWQQEARLHLSVSLPLEDLIVAAPAFEDLNNLPMDRELSAENTQRIAAYFAVHLGLNKKGAASLPLTLTRAALDIGKNDHVGFYKSLTLEFTAPLSAQQATAPQLTLAYDAVMHEVRNHRATVYWGKPGENPKGIADFGFRQQPVDLDLK